MTYTKPVADAEKRLSRLEKKFDRFYQTTYAYTRRKDRAGKDRHWFKTRDKLMGWDATFKKHGTVLSRIAAIFNGRRRAGTVAVYLTKLELSKLMRFLKKDFRGVL